MSYDVTEATKILADVRLRNDPRAYAQAKSKAAFGLRDAVHDAAKAAGYDVHCTPSGVVEIVHNGRGSVEVFVHDGDLVLTHPGPPQTTNKALDIEIRSRNVQLRGRQR